MPQKDERTRRKAEKTTQKDEKKTRKDKKTARNDERTSQKGARGAMKTWWDEPRSEMDEMMKTWLQVAGKKRLISM